MHLDNTASDCGAPASRTQIPAFLRRDALMTPSTQGTNKACTTDVQGMYKGCTRVVQGLYKGCTRDQHARNTGAMPEQCRSNAGATRSPRACLMGATWVLRNPETGCPAVAGLPSCRAQCRLLQT